MKIVSLMSRWVFGLIFLVFGLNGFFRFFPIPPQPEAAQDFMQALIATGYMLYLWKSVEVVTGVLLLANRFVPLALAISAPVVLNIFLFHVFLDPGNMLIGVVLLVIEIFLMWENRHYFTHFFNK